MTETKINKAAVQKVYEDKTTILEQNDSIVKSSLTTGFGALKSDVIDKVSNSLTVDPTLAGAMGQAVAQIAGLTNSGAAGFDKIINDTVTKLGVNLSPVIDASASLSGDLDISKNRVSRDVSDAFNSVSRPSQVRTSSVPYAEENLYNKMLLSVQSAFTGDNLAQSVGGIAAHSANKLNGEISTYVSTLDYLAGRAVSLATDYVKLKIRQSKPITISQWKTVNEGIAKITDEVSSLQRHIYTGHFPTYQRVFSIRKLISTVIGRIPTKGGEDFFSHYFKDLIDRWGNLGINLDNILTWKTALEMFKDRFIKDVEQIKLYDKNFSEIYRLLKDAGEYSSLGALGMAGAEAASYVKGDLVKCSALMHVIGSIQIELLNDNSATRRRIDNELYGVSKTKIPKDESDKVTYGIKAIFAGIKRSVTEGYNNFPATLKNLENQVASIKTNMAKVTQEFAKVQTALRSVANNLNSSVGDNLMAALKETAPAMFEDLIKCDTQSFFSSLQNPGHITTAGRAVSALVSLSEGVDDVSTKAGLSDLISFMSGEATSQLMSILSTSTSVQDEITRDRYSKEKIKVAAQTKKHMSVVENRDV